MREMQFENNCDELRRDRQIVRDRSMALAWNQQRLDKQRRQEIER